MRSFVLCLLAGVGLAATASADGPAIREIPDLVFGKGGGTDLRLDVAMPADGDGPFPVVVCIHGGGWVDGDRRQMTGAMQALARRGFVAVSPDYRLAPHDPFPAQIEDCKAAVRWLRANAQIYKIDPDHIGALGFASGGHLAELLAVTAAEDGLEGTGGNSDQSSRVQAVASFFSPTDLTAPCWNADVTAKNLIPLIGGTIADKPEAYRKASPLTYAGKNSAALLIFHGDHDKIVPLEQSQLLAAKINAAGGVARVIVLEGEGHDPRPDKLLGCIRQMTSFFDAQLKQKP
ncbi:MAG TPA: alpha/beta hydrolase [Gemmataceae bacterium]|nr:alpha/beta hydrolase [Gemmataceae bacterium]